MQQLTLDILQTAAPKLDNFVVGPNAEAVSIAAAIGAGQVPARTVLFWGPPGSGKSHLLQSVAAQRADSHRWLSPAHPESFEPTAGATVFLAHDIEQWPAEPLHRLFHLLNLLRPREDATVLVCSPQPPAGMTIRDDLRTRLAAGLVIGIALLSDAEKSEAMQQHALAQGHKDIQPVCKWLLEHRARDIRALMSYLDALDQFALQTRRPVTLRLLHEFERNRQQSKLA